MNSNICHGNITAKNILFYKATKSITKIKDPLLQNFIDQNAKKLLEHY